MIYLLLAILCSCALTISMRLSSNRAKSNMGVLVVNYIVCIILCIAFIGGDRLLHIDKDIVPTLLLGILDGVIFIITLIVTQSCINKNGVVMSSIFSKIGGLVLPLVISIFLFSEIPTVYQWIGFVLAIIAIIVMNMNKDDVQIRAKGIIFLMFTFEGLATIMSKIFNEWGNNDYPDHFLLFTFGAAALIGVVLLLRKGERIAKDEIIWGVIVGVSNFMASRFLLNALESIPAIIVYPSRAVCSIIIISLVGVCAFKEKLSRKQLIAMVGVLVSLVLLNL